MAKLAEKFRKLKTSVGGNREVTQYENSFGMPKEEEYHVARPTRANSRILGELEFALNLSRELGDKYDGALEEALDFLLAREKAEGVLTDTDCARAEDILAPMEKDAKAYQLILAAHAHIDMNWMWSYAETVAVVLATFRTMLRIMEEYPEFRFSQSQAAAYRMVEQYDPALMEQIKRRIREGRWEVTASSWVECDKNMPSTESLLNHIRYTREYLSEKWGVRDFDIDFSPDTFGHSANIPEIDTFGGIRYLYHCRGLKEDHILYRFRSPSGKELLAYREPYWYNGGITPRIGAGLPGLSAKCAGLKTGLVVYGVGDHGGGPTRRDVERALEMQSWRIFPKIRFGTLREFFREAESVRDRLPVVSHELNYYAPGCYTTQSRIKRGNRRAEAALYNAEALSALAGRRAGFPYAADQFRGAWRNVLFTHFHDLITGSCVQDSREHAMGLYQHAMAAADTQIQNAMRSVAEKIDTSSVPVEPDAYNSQSEGAGAGYGAGGFSGVAVEERGSGRTRIFHIFNTLPEERGELAELTVWDWTGDLRCLRVKDCRGNPLDFQLEDRALRQYWDHKYFRVLVDVKVPPLGYTTVVLSEAELERYPFYYQSGERVAAVYDDYVLENDEIAVRIDSATGRLRSAVRKNTGEEMLAAGETAGFSLIDTEAATSNAWQIGRYLRENPVAECVKIEKLPGGGLRSGLKATYRVRASTVEATYLLDRHQAALRIDARIDWNEVGAETVPVLCYRVPVSYPVGEYLYDIPGGTIRRKPWANDVPALRYGMAVNPRGESVFLASDCKYGYRGDGKHLFLTLINSATSPDPYPERGIQECSLLLGFSPDAEKTAEETAGRFSHRLLYVPSGSHGGPLPMEDSLLSFRSGSSVLVSLTAEDGGAVAVRLCEVSGRDDTAEVRFGFPVKKVESVLLDGTASGTAAECRRNTASVRVPAYSLAEIRVFPV